MRADYYPLNVPVGTAPGTGLGTSQNCADLIYKWVQIGGTFSGNCNIEVSINGTDWAVISTGITGGGIFQVEPTCKLIRINVTAWVSGQITAILSGVLTREC